MNSKFLAIGYQLSGLLLISAAVFEKCSPVWAVVGMLCVIHAKQVQPESAGEKVQAEKARPKLDRHPL